MKRVMPDSIFSAVNAFDAVSTVLALGKSATHDAIDFVKPDGIEDFCYRTLAARKICNGSCWCHFAMPQPIEYRMMPRYRDAVPGFSVHARAYWRRAFNYRLRRLPVGALGLLIAGVSG